MSLILSHEAASLCVISIAHGSGGQIMKGTVMTKNCVSVFIAAVVALGSAIPQPTQPDLYGGGVQDNYFAGSIKDAPPPPRHHSFYLKGYIGMHNHEVDGIDSDILRNGTFSIGHLDMKTAPFFGLGIGVDRGRWLRFDVTGEYRGKWLFIGQDSYNDGVCAASWRLWHQRIYR